jgi:hypothetical protein
MVKEVEIKGKRLFRCEECNMYYSEKELAEKCEKWCAEHHSCNLEIIRNAIDIERDKGGE